MINFVEGGVERRDGLPDPLLVMDPNTLILKGVYSISSSSIESRGVKESSSLVSFHKPADSGL